MPAKALGCLARYGCIGAKLYIQAYRQTETGWQADRQTGRQTDRQTCVLIHVHVSACMFACICVYAYELA